MVANLFFFIKITKTDLLCLGTCNDTSNTEVICLCSEGWTGDHCEIMINYCENITCENRGVCRRLFLTFTCDCVDKDYSGRYCEIVSKKLFIIKLLSKSVAYVAIIFLVGTITFFVIMDILKYCFGIDLTKDDLEYVRRARAMKITKKRRKPVIQRFTYVNASTTDENQETTL